MVTKQSGPILISTGEFESLTHQDHGLPSTTPAWIVTGAALLAGAAVCALLAIDRNEKVDDAATHKLAYAATETELVQAKSEIAANAPLLRDLEKDRAALEGIRGAEASAAAKATSLEAALKSELKREIAYGDARITRRGAVVTTSLASWIVLDGDDVGVRGVDVLLRLGAIIQPEGKPVRVVGHANEQSGANGAWAQSAGDAAAVARFLEENAEIPASKLEAVGRGAAEPVAPKGKPKNRRVELVVDEARK